MDFTTEQIYQFAFIGFTVLGFMTLAISLFVKKQSSGNKGAWDVIADIVAGFSSEMFAAVLTTLFIGFLIGNVQTNAAQNETRAEFILEMGSPNNDFAVEGTRKLRSRGWLTDGSLQDAFLAQADLSGANLEGANLIGANLSEAALNGANFANAQLQDANLQNAILRDVNLEGANLKGANLQDITFDPSTFNGANLTNAVLQGLNLRDVQMDDVILCGTDLRGVNLEDTGLENSDLETSILDGNTTLPNGDPWSEERIPLVPCESQ